MDSVLYVFCNADVYVIYVRASTQKLTDIIGLTTAAHRDREKAQTRKPCFSSGNPFFKKEIGQHTYTQKMRKPGNTLTQKNAQKCRFLQERGVQQLPDSRASRTLDFRASRSVKNSSKAVVKQ